MRKASSDEDKFNELSYYTLSHPGSEFIHQNIVDAYTAQTADDHSKPIVIAFALIGLYLHVERDFTGKEVQRAHMRLAKKRRVWPTFQLPFERGDITVSEVLDAPPGKARDEMIRAWCKSVWEAYSDSRNKTIELWTKQQSLNQKS